ncbi:hypothetical protein D3C71_1197670 [compost metagenome]
MDVDLVQGAGVVGGFGVGQRRQRGQAEAGSEAGSGQRQGAKRRSVLAAFDRVHGRLQRRDRKGRPALDSAATGREREMQSSGCAARRKVSGQLRRRCVRRRLATIGRGHRWIRHRRYRSVCGGMFRALQAQPPQCRRFVAPASFWFGFRALHRVLMRQRMWGRRRRRVLGVVSGRINRRRAPSFLQRRPAQPQCQQRGHKQWPTPTGKLAQQDGRRGRSHGAGGVVTKMLVSITPTIMIRICASGGRFRLACRPPERPPSARQ